MATTYQVAILDKDRGDKPRLVEVPAGETLLDAARRAGAEVIATCGERGRCRSCRIRIVEGEAPPPTIMDTVQLGHEEVQEQFRLSCQTRVIGDATVAIAPPRSESGHQVLGIQRRDDTAGIALDSGVAKHCIQVELPDDENHQSSDVEEILRQLPSPVTAPVAPELLRKVPDVVREKRGKITVTLFNGELIAIQAGDCAGEAYGIAFDIGTTSIVGSLLDLATGEELAAVGGVNPQSTYGGDLMSRIAYIQEDRKRLQTLRAKLLGALNGFIIEACESAGVDVENVHKLIVVGNTCMHHIFMGINPTYVGLAPYAPSVRDAIVCSGRELLLKTVPDARVCMLPIIAGFVGADTVAAALATRIYESEEMRCLVDIGTNGEVVMGRRGRLIACSAPAGPALEGGQIRHGMRGAIGAIEKVRITDDIEIKTIGDSPPIGICGSGLIDAVAAMLERDIINTRGLIRYDDRASFPGRLAARLRHRDDRDEFLLATDEESGKSAGISLNQSDIRQLQLAKGAICSGVMLMQHVLALSNDDLAEIILCGGFGNYVSRESALRIRLLPDVPLDRVTYFGNAAGLGAQMALLSETERTTANRLAREIEHVSLATHPEFQMVFVEALQFPPAGFTIRHEAGTPPLVRTEVSAETG